MSAVRRQPRGMGIQSGRRGQTLVLALSILFLLVLLGGIFVSMILRNLTRVSRQHKTDDALTLALAGIKYAADQMKNSPEGADWRPTPTELMWRSPSLTDIQQTDNALWQRLMALRPLDPDREWLGDFERPYVRFATGRGRFLLRVTYLPTFTPQSATSEAASRADLFDRNSGLIHIEAIGRPGEFDPNNLDPTFYEKDANNNPTPKRGLVRKVEAFVPVGLLDQLWWITNQTNERGPATLGVPPFVDANENTVEFPSLFEGTIRSNVDLQVNGRNVVRVYPARGEGLFVKGKLQFAPRGNAGGGIQLRIDAMDDTPGATAGVLEGDNHDDDPTNDSLIKNVNLDPTLPFDTGTVQTTGNEVLHTVIDEAHWRGGDPLLGTRSARIKAAPVLDQLDRNTGLNRWRRLTKYSGGNVDISGSGGTRVNAGMYGLTDAALPASIRARGLYIDNFDDIQYPKNRQKVRDEWLRREPTGLGWFAERYTPTVKGSPDDHPYRQTATPVVDIFLTKDAAGNPKIRVERWDPDVRLLNVPATVPTALRQFYDLTVTSVSGTGGVGMLQPTPYDGGRVKYFDPPENGVIFAEGSIRIRGTWGGFDPSDPANPDNPLNQPRPLTVVSGGTIYIDGNLLQERRGALPQATASGWQISLLAQDYITLNPTALVRLYPGQDVFQSADPNTGERFLQMPPGSTLDFTFASAEPLSSAFLQLRHSGKYQDNYSQTKVTLFRPTLDQTRLTSVPPVPWPDWTIDRYDFGSNYPPAPPPFGNYATNLPQLFYWFRQIPQQPGPPTINWAESNYQSVGPPFAWEQKTFFLPQITSDGSLVGGTGNPIPSASEVRFRLATGQELNSNEQDYLLSRVAIIPQGRPLPIRVEAVMYAYTGSWFVIPPPFMNRLPLDTRQNFDPNGRRLRRAPDGQPLGSFPENADLYPFYGEPLNVDIHVVGAITENMTAEPTEKAIWTNHTWVWDPGFDHTAVLGLEWSSGNRPAFSPLIRYTYDHNLRRMVRVKYTRPFVPQNAPQGTPPRTEEVVWLAGPGKPPYMRTLKEAWDEARDPRNDSYIVMLPVASRLPVGPVIYEGNPL